MMQRSSAQGEPVSIKGRGSVAANAGCLVAFFALFLIIGVGVFTVTFVRPALQIAAARSWTAVPCRIMSSNISSQRGSKSSTSYYFDVSYTYSFKGATYTGDRYSFAPRNGGSYNGKLKLVNLYPGGAAATCYVDPANPGEAVLERGFSGDVWVGLVPLIFAVVGAGGIIFSLRSQRQANRPQSKWRPAVAMSEAGSSTVTSQATWQPTALSPFDMPARGTAAAALSSQASVLGAPVALRPAMGTPVGRAVGLLLICIFWDGITGFMLIQFGKEALRGAGASIFGFLFSVPFVLIGAALSVAMVGAFLALLNARVQMTLSRAALAPGESADLQWKLSNGLFYPRQLNVWIEGREEATFQRGTDTHTDKSTFFRQELIEGAAVSHLRAGSVQVSIPAELMHSFESNNNKIVYIVTLHGPIALWPDIKEEFKLVVTPRGSVPRPPGAG